MNIYVIFAAILNVFIGFGVVVGFLVHPLLGAAIWGLGGYVIFLSGEQSGILKSARVVQQLLEEESKTTE